MIAIAEIMFWLSVGLVFHSYVLFPMLLKIFSAGKKENDVVFAPGDAELPAVYIVFSVFNEEKVIRAKLESIMNTTYPLQRMRVLIGSDNSTDATNYIVDGFAAKYAQISFYKFYQRNGKSGVINKLMAGLVEAGLSNKDVLIFTDANVMFTPSTIYEMVKHFKAKSIGQVAANILNKGMTAEGIAIQENRYIQRENGMKYLEGLNWGSMMGAFGACYAMRADCWVEIPKNYLMEDFYLSMNVLKNGEKAISELKAICYEDVSNEVGEEFKRKSRIQAGNFQNLGVYWPFLFRFNAVAFCFLSHKVIRWFGPLFIVVAYVANALLLGQGSFYIFSFVCQNLLLISPVIDAVLKKIGVHLFVLRLASYFYIMNLALVNGFVMYVRGVKTNAWNPTKRT